MLVVDASAVAELLVGTPTGAEVRSTLGEHGLHAPHLLSIEVASAVRSLTRRGQLSAAAAQRVVAELDDLGVAWYEHMPFLQRCLELRDVASAYDALYLALSEALAAPLLTCDAKLAKVRGHSAEIMLVQL